MGRITITYTANPSQRQVYLHGCNITETSRLNSIQVKVNTSLVHQFDLGYATASNSGQLLQAITEKGSDGTSLPPTTFACKPEVKSWNLTQEKWIDNQPVDAHLEMTDVRLLDITGDSLPDIVQSRHSGSRVFWRVLLNTGTSWQTQWTTWADLEDRVRLQLPNVGLMDVTGDNLPDIVESASSPGDWRVFRNTGSSWNPTPEI